jgi:hypothetical protein
MLQEFSPPTLNLLVSEQFQLRYFIIAPRRK